MCSVIISDQTNEAPVGGNGKKILYGSMYLAMMVNRKLNICNIYIFTLSKLHRLADPGCVV